MDTASPRSDSRSLDELRRFAITPDIAPNAAGSVLVEMGDTRVICGVSIDEAVPGWMRQQKVEGGWLTAEYSLLPYSTDRRARRETAKPSGRTAEIQRLIGRSMRMAIDLKKLGARTVWIDCDVLQADGGTRTAAITGAWVALRRAIDTLLADGRLTEDPMIAQIAAISVGVVEDNPMLDLCYTEDFAASVDMNVVMDEKGGFVEVQGTAESAPYDRPTADALLDLASGGISTLLAAQRASLEDD